MLIDGRALAASVLERVKADVANLVGSHKRIPGLCTILVGESPASQIYIRNKRKKAESVGLKSIHYGLASDTSQEELLSLIQKCNEDPNIDGILVQLPLPKQINETAVISAISPLKDVDGFHPENVGRLGLGTPRFVPCTPLGCLNILEAQGVKIEGANAIVIGRSNIVGKPMAQLLLQKNATVTVCHSKTKNLQMHLKDADIIVAAVGKHHLIQGKDIKAGAVVIDVGMNRGPDGKLSGDVDTEQALKKGAFVTPVPGGVGPMTIAMLMKNTLKAYQLNDERRI